MIISKFKILLKHKSIINQYKTDLKISDAQRDFYMDELYELRKQLERLHAIRFAYSQGIKISKIDNQDNIFIIDHGGYEIKLMDWYGIKKYGEEHREWMKN